METIVSEWTIAIEALDYDSVKSLYKSDPQLLWTPLQLSSHLESDFAPFIDRLKQLEKLGTSLRPLFAFQHILLDFATANDEFAADRLVLVEFFLQNSSAEQLNTCTWGSAQNTILHLAYFINHTHLIDQLLSKGALPKINALGYLPSQIKEHVKLMFSKRDNKAFLKNVPSADRFKQLQKFAAESSSQQTTQKKIERNKSTRHYFRPGHIEERKKKVLNEEEEKKRIAERQKEVELLAQRSAVKNNPLYKILEDKTSVDDENNDDHDNTKGLQQQEKSSSFNNNENRRASRVITSLKDNSYVSKSVFRQQSTIENDIHTVPSLEQLRAAAVTREMEGSSLSREMTSTKDKKQNSNTMIEEEVDIQEEAEILDENTSPEMNYNMNKNEEKDKEEEKEDDDKKIVLNKNNQDMTLEEEKEKRPSSTMSYKDDNSNVDDPSLEKDTLVHSIEAVIQPKDTQYDLPNDTKRWSTPTSFHDSDNNQIETSQESLQNTPTDTLYETEEVITPVNGDPVNHDYFSQVVVPVKDHHFESTYQHDSNSTTTFSEHIDDDDLSQSDDDDGVEEGILEFRGLSSEIVGDEKNDWYKISSDKAASTIRSSLSSCKQSNSTENTNYNQEEEEHFDYYSTKLHTDKQQQEEEGGEITVYLDRSSILQEQENIDLQTLDIRNLSNISFNNHSNLTLSSSVSSTRSSVLNDISKPRIEDISYYLSTLPVFEKEAALMDDDEENHSSKRECNYDEERNIPNAHEIDYTASPTPPFSDTLEMHKEQRRSLHSTEEGKRGKLYIGIRGAHNMLLPLPNEMTYARCVISDGKYEYISRYEILGREILLDYETVVDTLPGTIITVSLQVRPDYHVMPRTGIISKFFSSARKQKEHVSGYVHPSDGSISQTRFAVDAMIPKCYKKTFQSNFDCFNSWYTRSSQERAREKEDTLKIVGKLTVEMLYLPVIDETAAPSSLRECDLILKIKQWHATCWRSGYLVIENERHFYRLIGSQLIGYDEENQVYACYNIAKVLRLEGDSTLFRLYFKDHHIDCKSETRHWFKTFKSMIGRVPFDFTI